MGGGGLGFMAPSSLALRLFSRMVTESATIMWSAAALAVGAPFLGAGLVGSPSVGIISGSDGIRGRGGTAAAGAVEASLLRPGAKWTPLYCGGGGRMRLLPLPDRPPVPLLLLLPPIFLGSVFDWALYRSIGCKEPKIYFI